MRTLGDPGEFHEQVQLAERIVHTISEAFHPGRTSLDGKPTLVQPESTHENTPAILLREKVQTPAHGPMWFTGRFEIKDTEEGKVLGKINIEYGKENSPRTSAVGFECGKHALIFIARRLRT